MSRGWGDGAEVEVDMSTWSRRSGDGQGSGSVSAPSSSVEGSRSDYDAHGVPRSPGSLPAADASPSPVRVHDVVIRRVGEIRNDVLDRFRAIMRLERRKKRGEDGKEDDVGGKKAVPDEIEVDDFPIQPGEASKRVRALQRYLVREGLLSSKHVSGVFDTRTVSAVQRWNDGEAGKVAPDGKVPSSNWVNEGGDHWGEAPEWAKEPDEVGAWSVADFVTMAKAQRDRVLQGVKTELRHRRGVAAVGEQGEEEVGVSGKKDNEEDRAWSNVSQLAEMARVQKERAELKAKQKEEKRISPGRSFAEMARMQKERAELKAKQEEEERLRAGRSFAAMARVQKERAELEAKQEKRKKLPGRIFADMVKVQRERRVAREKEANKEAMRVAAWLSEGAKVQAQRASEKGDTVVNLSDGNESALGDRVGRMEGLKRKLSQGSRTILDPSVRTSPAMIIGACATSAAFSQLLGSVRGRHSRRTRMKELGLMDDHEMGWDRTPRGSPMRLEDQGYPWRRSPSGYTSDGSGTVSDHILLSARKSSESVLGSMDVDEIAEEVAVSVMAVIGTSAALKVYLEVSVDVEATEDEALEAGRAAVRRATEREAISDEVTLTRSEEVANLAIIMAINQIKGDRTALLLAQCSGRTPKFVMVAIEDGIRAAVEHLGNEPMVSYTTTSVLASLGHHHTEEIIPALDEAAIVGQEFGVSSLSMRGGKVLTGEDMRFAEASVREGVRAGVHALKEAEEVESEEFSREDIAIRAGQWAAEKLYEDAASKLDEDVSTDARRQVQRIGIFAAETFVRQFYKEREAAKLNRAASCIQRAARSRLDCKNQAATKIQAVHRGKAARAQTFELRQKYAQEIEDNERRITEEEERKRLEVEIQQAQIERDAEVEEDREPKQAACGCLA